MDLELSARIARKAAGLSVRATAAELASEIRDALDQDEWESALRFLIQLSDNLVGEDLHLVTSLVTTPADAGDQRFNAAIAGLVEWRLLQRDLPVPEWAQAIGPLSEQWWMDDFGVGTVAVVEATPEPLRRRNVFVDHIVFASV